jgi:hypothetical protein
MAAGSIVVDLLMKTGSFETDTKRAEKRSREMAREIDKAFKMVGVAVAAAGAAFIAMTKSVIDNADALAKSARSIGISTESLSGLQYAAELSGVSANELNTSLARLNKGAADGNKAFDAMGISVRDAQGNLKATDTLLKEVSDKFASYTAGAEKSALAQELFGRSGDQLISFLNSGSEGLTEMQQEAERLGIIISGDLAKASEQFNDNITRITKSVQGLVIQLVGPLIGALARVTTEFLRATQAGESFFGAIERGLRGGVVGDRSTIDGAARDIERLTIELQKLDNEIAKYAGQEVPEFLLFRQGDVSAQLAAAMRNYQTFARQLAMPAPETPQMVAPMVADQAAIKRAVDEAKKERESYDQWMRSMQDGENRYRLDMVDKRIAAEKQAEQKFQAWMDEMREGELQQYLRMQDLKDQRIREANEKLKRYADDLGMAFGNAFENAILTGQRLSDTLRQLAQDILRLVMRQTITNPIAEAISGSIGQFMGARANGGPVTGGGTYMVGERGPELFVPNTSGMIVPHEALQGGGGGVTVQQTINVTTGVQQTVRAEILSLLPQISNAAKAAVADAKLRGGSYAAALR